MNNPPLPQPIPDRDSQSPDPLKTRTRLLQTGMAGLMWLLFLCLLAFFVVIVTIKPLSPKPTPVPTFTPIVTGTPRSTAIPTIAPIRIALLVPLSGPDAASGQSGLFGMQMAVDEWNNKGGILGRKIVTIIEDSRCASDSAVYAASKVIERDKVHYIIGELCSLASAAVSEIANSAGVVQISPTSADQAILLNSDGSVKPYIFSVGFEEAFQAVALAKFAHARELDRAFILSDPSNRYSSELAQAFEQAFVAEGGIIAGKETYHAADTSFSAILDKVYASKAEILYVPDSYEVVNRIGTQAKAKQIPAILMGGDDWDSPNLDLAALDGGFFTSQFSILDPRAVVQAWINSLDNRVVASPDATAALTYDATNLLLTAIGNAGMDDPAAVKAVLAGIHFEGVTGTLTFDLFHNPIKSVVVLKVENGEIVYKDTVKP